MKIYIIGASGFIGTHLVRWLQKNAEIRKAKKYDKNNFSEWQNAVLDDIVDFAPDLVIVPGASQKMDDDAESLHDLITSNCLFPALVAQRLVQDLPLSKLIIFGTSWQFADSDSYRPFNLYAASKQAGQDILTHYALQGLKISYIILFDTYGENDERKKIINVLQNAVARNESISTTFGDQEIDLVHIEDVCAGVECAIKELEVWDASNGLLVRGLGSGAPITVKELIKRLGATAILGGLPYRNREVMKVYRNYQRPMNWAPLKTKYQNKINKNSH